MDIKDFRKRHKLSQGELGKMAGVGWRTVQNWETTGKIPAATKILLEKIIEEKEKEKAAPVVSMTAEPAVQYGETEQPTDEQPIDQILFEMKNISALLKDQLQTKDNQIDKLLDIIKQK